MRIQRSNVLTFTVRLGGREIRCCCYLIHKDMLHIKLKLNITVIRRYYDIIIGDKDVI